MNLTKRFKPRTDDRHATPVWLWLKKINYDKYRITLKKHVGKVIAEYLFILHAPSSI
jgi:hypothetical protein